MHAEMAIIDGELPVPDATDRTVFASSEKRRREARFYAFALLWFNGEDLRGMPLLARIKMLKEWGG